MSLQLERQIISRGIVQYKLPRAEYLDWVLFQVVTPFACRHTLWLKLSMLSRIVFQSKSRRSIEPKPSIAIWMPVISMNFFDRYLVNTRHSFSIWIATTSSGICWIRDTVVRGRGRFAKGSHVYVNTIDERCKLHHDGTTNFDDNGYDEKIDYPVDSDWAMVPNGIGDLSNTVCNTEKDSRNRPTDDIENDQRNSTDMKVPTNLTMKINRPTDN
jgi:hypothetical protein